MYQRFTFSLHHRFHDMDNVSDFIILEQVYNDSLKRQWSSGDRFQSLIDDQYWSGIILKQSPFSEDTPNSVWQMYHIKWDDGATDQLSPWDLHPVPMLQNSSNWDNKDKERILHGLEFILKNTDELKEARMFLNPVDLEEESEYCTVVAFPTSISTIAERLRNGFYRYSNVPACLPKFYLSYIHTNCRQKIALIWEVVLLAHNARDYNEEDSLISKNGEIVAQTLIKFIK